MFVTERIMLRWIYCEDLPRTKNIYKKEYELSSGSFVSRSLNQTPFSCIQSIAMESSTSLIQTLSDWIIVSILIKREI